MSNTVHYPEFAIPALSLWEPWASLMAWDQKRIETRSWPTKYRGPMAIHAAKTMQHVAELPEATGELVVELGRLGPGQRRVNWGPYYRSARGYPFGRVVAVGFLVDVVPVEALRAELTAKERQYGDYSDGRYGWIFDPVRILQQPEPATGRQGLWNWQFPKWVRADIEALLEMRQNMATAKDADSVRRMYASRFFGLPVEQVRYFDELAPAQKEQAYWWYGKTNVEPYVYAVKRNGDLVAKRERRKPEWGDVL
ncbi:MAG: hypothetical protein FOGNACKC_00829 [Anaerolineae bacterium]|nr:hypothetical protein [Anaerolineae bacterium]